MESVFFFGVVFPGEYFESRFLIVDLLEQLVDFVFIGVHDFPDFLEVHLLFLLLDLLGAGPYVLEAVVILQDVLLLLLQDGFILGHVVGIYLFLEDLRSGLGHLQLYEGVHFFLA